jgi:hypothetical protein
MNETNQRDQTALKGEQKLKSFVQKAFLCFPGGMIKNVKSQFKKTDATRLTSPYSVFHSSHSRGVATWKVSITAIAQMNVPRIINNKRGQSSIFSFLTFTELKSL